MICRVEFHAELSPKRDPSSYPSDQGILIGRHFFGDGFAAFQQSQPAVTANLENAFHGHWRLILGSRLSKKVHIGLAQATLPSDRVLVGASHLWPFRPG